MHICADLPASLMQKFNAAAGNHSKKLQPKGVYRDLALVLSQCETSYCKQEKNHISHIQTWHSYIHTFLGSSCSKNSFSLTRCPVAEYTYIYMYALHYVAACCRRDVKVEASVEQWLVGKPCAMDFFGVVQCIQPQPP